MNKINIAELLKDCPKGMELDCSVFEDVTLYKIDTDIENDFPIRIKTKNDYFLDLTKYGTYSNVEEAKCLIFPKGKTTWEGFHKPFKDGDILSYQYKGFKNRSIYIYMQHSKMNTTYYVALSGHSNSEFMVNDREGHALNGYNDSVRLATEEEKEKLFQAIKANGYKWNAETKTLEKLIEPKFKVGDVVIWKHCTTTPKIIKKVQQANDGNFNYWIEGEGCIPGWCREDELQKFDINALVPFESRVLVRDTGEEKWKPAIWGYYDISNIKYFPYETVGGNCFNFCIPYEGNEHLLGTTDDCVGYFKTCEK